MQTKNDLHPYQMQILYKIMFLPEAKFKDLKISTLTSDLLTYHINKLIQLGLIERSSNTNRSIYLLTTKGKQYINTIDTETAQQEVFGKRSVLLRHIRFNPEKNNFEYLVYKRLKQPFFGFYGFHTGKIRQKETILQASRREFSEETSLKIKDFEFVAIFHMIDFDKDGNFVRDLYLYTFNIYSSVGELRDNQEDGVQNVWMTKDQLKKVKTYPGFWEEGEFNWVNLERFYKKYEDSAKKGLWTNPTDPISQSSVAFIEKVRVIGEY